MPERTQSHEDYYVYEVDFNGLAPGNQQNGNIQIQADSDFKWLTAAYHADIAAAAFTDDTRPIPNVTVAITDQGSGRQLTQNPVPIPSIFGTGRLPFVLPIPRVFRARSSIGIDVVNFDAAATYNIRLSFIGTKLYYAGNEI